MPPILKTIFDMGRPRSRGMIEPGHVAVITGTKMFEPLARSTACRRWFARFEPLDILMACYMLCKQIEEEVRGGEQYTSRQAEGNPKALKLMDITYDKVDKAWRVPRHREERPRPERAVMNPMTRPRSTRDILSGRLRVEAEAGMQMRKVLRGLIRSECPMWQGLQTIALGPCMVSAEEAATSRTVSDKMRCEYKFRRM